MEVVSEDRPSNTPNFLRNSLTSLKSKFEAASTRFQGIKCSICREPFAQGKTPIADAYHSTPHDPGEGLRPIIRSDVDGMRSFSSHAIAHEDILYHFWMVHERFRETGSLARRSPDFGSVFLDAQEQAGDCETLFGELAEEGGRLLENISLVSHPQLNGLLSRKILNYRKGLWIVAMFCLARNPPAGTTLRTTMTVPRDLGLDLFESTWSEEVPDSVIVNLDGNPFSASVVLVDVLLENVEQPLQGNKPLDGPFGAYQWRLNGKVLKEQMQASPWRLVEFLWNQEHKSASFDELKVPVYSDDLHEADEGTFGALRSKVNAYFKKHDIPYAVSIKKGKVLLSEISSEDPVHDQ
jgi:hypothetical protein